MAPPALQTYTTYTDTEVRDIYHRTQHQVVPTGNVIHKLHTHYDTPNSTPILSSIIASTMDSTNTMGAWNLLLRSDTNPLSKDDITTENSATWFANSTIIATPDMTSLHSGNVVVTGNLNSNIFTANVISCNTISISSDVTFANLTSNKLTVDNGPVILDDKYQVSLNKTIPNGEVQYQGVTIGTISNVHGGGYTAELHIVQSEGLKNAISKKYIITGGNVDTGGVYQRLLPISSSATANPYEGNDLGVDMKVTPNPATGGMTTELSLVRTYIDVVDGQPDTSNVISSNIQCSLVISQSKSHPVGFTNINTTYYCDINDSADLNSIFQGTLLSNRYYRSHKGVIAVGTDQPDPRFIMDVNGNVLVKSVRSTGAVEFGSKYRLNYNDATDSLDIERNTGSEGSPVWEKTATLASL